MCQGIKFPAHGGRENEMATSVKQMMEAANAAVPKITPAQAKEMIAKGNTLVVDVRDGTEVAASGKVAGAVHVSRGLLEFRADPELPSHDKNFAKDKDVILYCGSGGRAALGRQAAQGFGLRESLQSRRLQRLGQLWRRDRKVTSRSNAETLSPVRAFARRLARRTRPRPRQCPFRRRRCRLRRGCGERHFAWQRPRLGRRDCRR